MNPSAIERVGIPPESFMDPVWFGVVKVYFETVNGHYVPTEQDIEMGRYHTAEQALEAFDGYRFGSRLSMHSKLKIRTHALGGLSLVYFDFNPNSASDEDARLVRFHKMTVDDLTQGFRTGVDEYLLAEVGGAQQFQPTL